MIAVASLILVIYTVFLQKTNTKTVIIKELDVAKECQEKGGRLHAFDNGQGLTLYCSKDIILTNN